MNRQNKMKQNTSIQINKFEGELIYLFIAKR